MAKFKVGDKVTDGNAVYEITGIDNDFGSYEWKLISGRADPSHSEGGNFGWADAKMKAANACKNAKFKVGDRVKYKGYHPKIRGKSGTVSFVGIPGDDPTYLTVDMDNGEEWGAPEKDWVLSNSRACNATPTSADIARFWELAKKYHGGGIGPHHHELEVLEDKFLWDVTDVNPRTTTWSGNPPKVSVSPWAHESWSVWKNSRACNSTNPVVAKALNARGTARNGWQSDKRADGTTKRSFSMDLGDARMYYFPEGPTPLEIEAWEGMDFKYFGDVKTVKKQVEAEMRKCKATMDKVAKILAWVEQNAK